MASAAYSSVIADFHFVGVEEGASVFSLPVRASQFPQMLSATVDTRGLCVPKRYTMQGCSAFSIPRLTCLSGPGYHLLGAFSFRNGDPQARSLWVAPGKGRGAGKNDGLTSRQAPWVLTPASPLHSMTWASHVVSETQFPLLKNGNDNTFSASLKSLFQPLML